MLDTNVVSNIVRGNAAVAKRLTAIPMTSLCVSVLTEGELLFGLAKRPGATTLGAGIRAYLIRLDILPWDSAAAHHYGLLRAAMERTGRVLDAIDTLIAAHAISAAATLVTSDRAFDQVPGLSVEDWAA